MKKLILLVTLFVASIGLGHLYFHPSSIQDDSIAEIFFSEGHERDEEDERTDKPNELMLYQAGIRTRMGDKVSGYKHGYLVHELLKAKSHRKSISKSLSGARTASLQFVERGPSNVPGRITALINLPNDPNNNSWLAGAATGGIWKTIDGGKTWVAKGEDFPALPIASFAIANDNTIYVGTGEHVSTYVYSAIGAGIFKSTDFGETWTSLTTTVNNPDFAIITRLIVDPNNSNVIVASCVPTNTNQSVDSSSIMKSIDGGITWAKTVEIEGTFDQVIATPGNFNILYASQNNVGVWKSIDAGDTWALSNSSMYPVGRSEIAVSPQNPNYVYVASESLINGTGSDLYFSKNAGNTWSILDVGINGSPVNFLGGQGFYDNVIICDPFNQNSVYFGGVNLFQTKVNGGTSFIDNYKIAEQGTTGFLYILSYSGIEYDRGRLTVGANNRKAKIEIRFGPGVGQKAHRFMVPPGKTGGVQASDYSYQGYVNVPFEVWDVSSVPAKQLMVSFRDQNRNGAFDLLHRYPVTAGDTNPLLNSREYIFINDIPYNSGTYNQSIGVDGGQEYRLMYSFFPALASADSVWDPLNVPSSKLTISYEALTKLSCSTQTVADAYYYWDGKNQRDQENLSNGVHPDHHALTSIVVDQTAKTFKLLLGNDGGVFVTKASTAPGTQNGDFTFCGNTLNVGQFYSADKCPLIDQYVGGMQDNGTRVSPIFSTTQPSGFNYAIGGDGFEVIWNNLDSKQLLGCAYTNYIFKSLDGGKTWNQSHFGINNDDSPFYTKLSNSKDYPNRVFAIGVDGVYRSTNFGSSWNLVSISDNFSNGNPSFLDVEVSRANANIVWAGSGMFDGALNLQVSIDGGSTFNKTNNFSNLGYCTKLASHPTDPNTAYAIFSFSGLPKILKTSDLGKTWEDITEFSSGASTNGFPDVAVFCVYVHADDPNVIWAGTEIGIVESIDAGKSWSLIPSNKFPHVSVFDMKGQDNQIIIATNGRGIWTADVAAPQSVNIAPSVSDFGTSPLKDLELKIQLDQVYDSIEVFVDGLKTRILRNFVSPGTLIAAINNIPVGSHTVYLVGYKNNAPVQSVTYPVNQINVLSVKDIYSNFFKDASELYLQGFKLATLSSENPKLSLQSDHSYKTDKTYTSEFLHPIKIGSGESVLIYSDIAIIATGVGKDSIVFEASTDGLNWKPLAPAYNASAQLVWNNAYLNKTSGNSSMYVQHSIDLKNTFSTGDIILIRTRLSSDNTNSSWGYALDYVFMQVPSIETGIEESPEVFNIYPNPSSGKFTLKYSFEKNKKTVIVIYDMTGRKIYDKELSATNDRVQYEEIDVPGIKKGHYVLTLTRESGMKSTRLLVE